MKLLLIETSTRNYSVAVSDKEKVLCQRNVKLDKLLESSMVPGIRRVLAKAGLALNAIDGFAVGLGPGSFTSLRVGLSTVKAMAFALNKPLVGIPSLDCLAMNSLSVKAADICVMMDARRNQVYSCLYSVKEGKLERKIEYALVRVEEALKTVKGKTVFLGDGVDLYKETIELGVRGKSKKIVYEPVFCAEKMNFPKAAKMLPLALDRFRKKAYDNIDNIVPLYLYPEDCQVRR